VFIQGGTHFMVIQVAIMVIHAIRLSRLHTLAINSKNIIIRQHRIFVHMNDVSTIMDAHALDHIIIGKVKKVNCDKQSTFFI
jgi:hypothetical protein